MPLGPVFQCDLGQLIVDGVAGDRDAARILHVGQGELAEGRGDKVLDGTVEGDEGARVERHDRTAGRQRRCGDRIARFEPPAFGHFEMLDPGGVEGVFQRGRLRLAPLKMNVLLEILDGGGQLDGDGERALDLVRFGCLGGEGRVGGEADLEEGNFDADLAADSDAALQLGRAPGERGVGGEPGLEGDGDGREFPAIAPGDGETSGDAASVDHQVGVSVPEEQEIGADAAALGRVLPYVEMPIRGLRQVEIGLSVGGQLGHFWQAPGGVDVELHEAGRGVQQEEHAHGALVAAGKLRRHMENVGLAVKHEYRAGQQQDEQRLGGDDEAAIEEGAEHQPRADGEAALLLLPLVRNGDVEGGCGAVPLVPLVAPGQGGRDALPVEALDAVKRGTSRPQRDADRQFHAQEDVEVVVVQTVVVPHQQAHVQPYPQGFELQKSVALKIVTTVLVDQCYIAVEREDAGHREGKPDALESDVRRLRRVVRVPEHAQPLHADAGRQEIGERDTAGEANPAPSVLLVAKADLADFHQEAIEVQRHRLLEVDPATGDLRLAPWPDAQILHANGRPG